VIGGFGAESAFRVSEGQSASAGIYGKLTTASVPVTGAILLLARVLAGFAAVKRLFKK
jgi:hypothetical protein